MLTDQDIITKYESSGLTFRPQHDASRAEKLKAFMEDFGYPQTEIVIGMGNRLSIPNQRLFKTWRVIGTSKDYVIFAGIRKAR